MTKTLIEFEVNKNLKDKAEIICKDLGIDISDYLNTCLSRLVLENGMPSFNNKESNGIKALKEMSKSAKNNELSNMTLDEINEEICEVRKSY